MGEAGRQSDPWPLPSRLFTSSEAAESVEVAGERHLKQVGILSETGMVIFLLRF